MKKTTDRTQTGPICFLCGKTAVMGINKPFSQKRTKRLVKPNIQSYFGLSVCTRCRRTIKTQHTQQHEAHAHAHTADAK